MRFSSVEEITGKILTLRSAIDPDRSVLIGLSGIDACGKGYMAKQVVDLLNAENQRAVVINIDGWLNLPERRFSDTNPAFHFYRNAIRFEEMFSQLVVPLVHNRSVDMTVDFTEETAKQYRKHRYLYEDIDIVVLEGIYLFKKEFRGYFDLAIWIECSFETALNRAIRRAQEGLPPEETVRTYERIYFPAQRLHFQTDNPCQVADWIILNDSI